MADVSDSEVLEAFGVMKTNCVGVVAASDKNVMARAVYPVAALINHSCVPNLDPMVQAAGNFGFKVSNVIYNLQLDTGQDVSTLYRGTKRVLPRLRECCRQVALEEISNSEN